MDTQSGVTEVTKDQENCQKYNEYNLVVKHSPKYLKNSDFQIFSLIFLCHISNLLPIFQNGRPPNDFK